MRTLDLLREAASRYDASPALRAAAPRAARGGFGGGARWMALALAEARGAGMRGRASGIPERIVGLGVAKYGAAAAAALGADALTAHAGAALGLLAGVAAFYLVEAQGVFVFPAAIDGASSPWRASRALVRRSGGTVAVAARTALIAASMLFGGLLGRGFLRSWCAGCLAVVLWYEELSR